MCTVIHEFEHARLLLCPTTQNSTTPSPSVPSPSVPSPDLARSPSPSHEFPSETSSQFTDCIRQCSSPSPFSSKTKGNSSNNSSNRNSRDNVDNNTGILWLHILWCLPLLFLLCICYRRRYCSKIKVGISQRRRRYEMRSKSWPRRVHTPHPAVATRSKSESFDAIVI